MVNGIPKIIGRSQAGTTPASRKLARVDVCAIGTPGLRAFRVCRGKGTQDTNKHCGHSTLRHGPCNGRICEPDADFGDLQLGKSDGSATGRPALLDNQAKLLSCCGPGSMTNSKDFREEKKTLGIKCWCIADGWWDNIPLAGRDFPPVACFDSGGSWDARWCACAVAHAAVWRKSDLWRSMDGWKENWGWWAWEGFSVFGGTPTKTGERVCKMTHNRVMYRHITQGWTLVWRLFLAQKEVSVRLTLLIDLQAVWFALSGFFVSRSSIQVHNRPGLYEQIGYPCFTRFGRRQLLASSLQTKGRETMQPGNGTIHTMELDRNSEIRIHCVFLFSVPLALNQASFCVSGQRNWNAGPFVIESFQANLSNVV